MAGGRPKIKIDWEEFDKLCALQCTQKEIASWFNCTDDTINNRVKKEKKVSFSEYYSQKAAKGKISLRRKQWQSCESGSVAMLIWMGKQYLDQKDRREVTEGQAAELTPFSEITAGEDKKDDE
ncbi:MAG: hypothetical protein OEM38_00420 [Gammaproteobacteria bacterium]|nr:hypothetical protein [Gammaproteobacteria bacterium]